MSFVHIFKNHIFRAIILLPLAMILAGCSTDFSAVRKEQAETYDHEITNKTERILSIDKTYDLESCIEIALENNLDIKISEINGRLAGIDRSVAFSYFLPQIDVQFTHTKADKLQTRNAFGNYIAMADQDTTVTVIKGQLAVFNPEAWFLYSTYKRGEDIQNLVTLRVRQAIRLQVTALYLSCLSLESNIPALETSVDQAKALLGEMKAFYREGLILKSELEEARVFEMMQKQSLSEMKRLKTYTKSQLLEAMGLSPLSEIKLGAPPSLPSQDKELSDMVLTAMLNRPEMMISDRNVEVRENAIKMAILAFLPRIFLVGDLTSNRDSYLRYRDIFTYGVSAILTLFDGFSNIYQYEAAKEERSRAMLEREQSCIKIILEVIKAKQSLDREKDNRELMKLELSAAGSRLNEVMSLWKEGMVTSSEKLNAVRLNASAESNMAMAEYRYQVALATMADVMGISGKE